MAGVVNGPTCFRGPIQHFLNGRRCCDGRRYPCPSFCIDLILVYVDDDKLFITEQGCNNAARIDVILSHKLPFAEIRVFFR